MNFSQIGPVVFCETCLQIKNNQQTGKQGWQLGNNYMDEIHQGQMDKVPNGP